MTCTKYEIRRTFTLTEPFVVLFTSLFGTVPFTEYMTFSAAISSNNLLISHLKPPLSNGFIDFPLEIGKIPVSFVSLNSYI